MSALTKDILSCTYEQHGFSHCAALDAFVMNRDAYLRSEDADKALVDMITGPDEKLAVIAAQRNPSDRALTDKVRVAKLFDTAENAKTAYVVEKAAVGWLARVDIESLGFGDRLKAIAKNPATDVREAFGTEILVSPSDKTAAFELVTTLLADTDDEVAARAAAGLVRVPTPSSKSCELIRNAIERESARADHIAQVVASANCDGLSDRIIGYIGKRTSDGIKVPKVGGRDMTDAVWIACRNQRTSDEAKTRAYAIGLSMTKDPEVRGSAVEVLASCDPKKAPGDLEKLTHDKDELVRNVAKARIDELKKSTK